MKRKLRVLIVYEKSGVMRRAFAKHGWDAWSCDIEPSEDNSPKHYQGDAFDLLYARGVWDLVIFHPVCTYMSKVGARWMSPERHKLRDEAIANWKRLQEVCDAPFQAYENPTPFVYVTDRIGNYTQAINPWQFGHEASKRTCLWLINLPHLKPTRIVAKGEMIRSANGTNAKWMHYASVSERVAIRSRTFEGIAAACAKQWTKHIKSTYETV